MTTEHSLLTGSSLHEPKGVASAAANRVYVSNGAGSGGWGQIPVSALDTTSKVFQAQLLHVREEQASGVNSGATTAGTWQTRPLNTVKTNEVISASVSANQIILPSGTYFIQATCPGRYIGGFKSRLRNITDSTTAVVGTTEVSGNSGATATTPRSFVNGRFTLAGTKTLELQQYSQAVNIVGMGVAVGSGEVEVYAEVQIWKIA